MFLTSDKPKNTKAGRSFDEVIALLDGAGGKTDSGIYVNTLKALEQTTVKSCVRILSEIIAQLPIEVQEKQANRWITAEQHDLNGLLAEPNDWQTQHDLISFIVAWSELKGNSHLYKIRNGAGVVRQVLPLEADNVSIDINSDWSLNYTVSSDAGLSGTFQKDRIFHLRNFGSQGYVGLSTIDNHREGIGLALQLEKHAVKAYKNGLQGNKWVELERAITEPDQIERFKAELRKFQGTGNSESGGVPALSGAKIHEFTSMKLTDAQFVELWNMVKEETATVFLVPVFLLNSTKNTTWGSGLEQISRAFIRFALNPRLNRLSQTLVREFIPAKDRQKTRIVFDTDQFTLGEFKERMDGYRSGIEAGVLTPNDALEMEGRNPRAGGDEYRIPVNIQTEAKANELQNTPPPPAD